MRSRHPIRARVRSTSLGLALAVSVAGFGCHLSDREIASPDAPAAEVPAPIVTGPPHDSPGSPDGGAALDAGAAIDAPTSDDASVALGG